MRICDYCGKANEEWWESCSGCGKLLMAREETPGSPGPAPSAVPPLLSEAEAPSPRVLRAGLATVVLGAYLAAQVLGGIVLGLIVVLGAGHSTEGVEMALDRVLPALVLVLMVLSYPVVVLLSAALVPRQLGDASPTGAAWIRGSWSSIARGALVGLLIGGTFVAAGALLHIEPRGDPGPLTRMAETPGFPQVVWLMAALALAPPIEELLFRGILYGGYRKSFGAVPAALVTTLIFVLLHFTEIISFPAAALGIAALALGALWCRLRFRAIGPAIAVHVGYNAVVVLGTLFATGL